MIGSLISLVIYLVVVGLIFWLLLYMVDNLPMLQPFHQIARVAILVVGCLVAILILLQFLGVVGGDLPKLSR